jgi:hypothetical protein
MGANGDKIGYICTFHSIVGARAQTGRKENNETYSYVPRISLREDYYDKFCSTEELKQISQIICDKKSGTHNDDWRTQTFNICTMAVAIRCGEDAVSDVFNNPDLCALCDYMYAIEYLTARNDRYETEDLSDVTRHYGRSFPPGPTRVVYWSLEHDRNTVHRDGPVFRHDVWLWGHPHFFWFDVEWKGFTIERWAGVNRLERDCIFECQKLRKKWERIEGNEFRCKSLYRFPGPPSKLVHWIRPDIWEHICVHLFAQCTGIMLCDLHELYKLWEDYGIESMFSAYLQDDLLLVSERVHIIRLDHNYGINTVPWDIHDYDNRNADERVMEELVD